MLNQLQISLPQILRDIMLPSGVGLLYLALLMAGLLMIIPGIDHKRLIDLGRAILWVVVVGAFFISGTIGYDIIGGIEKLRADTTQIIIGAQNRNLDDLVSKPMLATPTDLINYSIILPNNFETVHFPEPTSSDYDDREAEIMDSALVTWKMDVKVEKESSQQDRREKAQTGLAISGLTIIGAVVLVMIAFILATLTASAIILIMFFLISLPVGFFEFGSAIISGIVKQYTYIWAMTLLTAILPSILIAANSLAYSSTGATELNKIMNTVPILIIVAIATSYVSAMAGQAMLDTFSVISTSISTAMAPLNYAGSMPQGGMLGGGPLQAGGNVAATAVLAAATGGASAALMAGGGALIGGVSKSGGQAAGAMATGMMGQKASVFATAAQGRGATQVAQIAGTYRRRQRQKRKREEEESARAKEAQTKANEKAQAKADKKFATTRAPSDSIPEEEQHFVNAGSYLTLDSDDLEQAEKAFKSQKYSSTRHYLTRAFGSREVANQAMRQYRQHGAQGMSKVRDMAEAAQATALQMTMDGETLFDASGNQSGDFRKRTWATLSKRRSIDASSQEDAALGAQIAGATIRQPTDIWSDPFAGSQLAQHVGRNPDGEHPYSHDAAAAFALHDMAASGGWTKQQLQTIFEATLQGKTLAATTNITTPEATRQRMDAHAELNNLPSDIKNEAGRLASLIIGPESPQAKQATQIAKDLTEQVLEPHYPHLAHIDSKTQKRINSLNKLSIDRDWGEDELNALFETILEEESVTPAHIANQVLLKEKQKFTIGNREDREQGAALAIAIATGTIPATPVRTKPSSSELTQKALHPDSNQVLIRDEKTEKNVAKLNKLAESSGWTEQELQPIFQAAASATDSDEADHLTYIANQLYKQGVPVNDQVIRAANLAVKIQGGVMLAPQPQQQSQQQSQPQEQQQQQPTQPQEQQQQQPTEVPPPPPPQELPEWSDQVPQELPEWSDQVPPELPEWLDQAPPPPVPPPSALTSAPGTPALAPAASTPAAKTPALAPAPGTPAAKTPALASAASASALTSAPGTPAAKTPALASAASASALTSAPAASAPKTPAATAPCTASNSVAQIQQPAPQEWSDQVPPELPKWLDQAPATQPPPPPPAASASAPKTPAASAYGASNSVAQIQQPAPQEWSDQVPPELPEWHSLPATQPPPPPPAASASAPKTPAATAYGASNSVTQIQQPTPQEWSDQMPPELPEWHSLPATQPPSPPAAVLGASNSVAQIQQSAPQEWSDQVPPELPEWHSLPATQPPSPPAAVLGASNSVAQIQQSAPQEWSDQMSPELPEWPKTATTAPPTPPEKLITATEEFHQAQTTEEFHQAQEPNLTPAPESDQAQAQESDQAP